MNTSIRLVALAALLVLTSSAAWAQGASVAQPAAQAVDESKLAIGDAGAAAPASATGSSILPYILRMVVVLGIIIAIIYGLYALLKRSAKPSSPEDAYLRVLATTSLGSGRNVHVVSLGDKAWLVGATDSSVSRIADIDDKELVDALALRASESPAAPRGTFASMLSSLLKPQAGKTGSATKDFFAQQRDRLKKF